MMASQSSRTERAPVDKAVADWIRVVNKFPHKPAHVVFDSYYFSTGSLSRPNALVSDGDAGHMVFYWGREEGSPPCY